MRITGPDAPRRRGPVDATAKRQVRGGLRRCSRTLTLLPLLLLLALLDAAAAATAAAQDVPPTTVILVRHAEKLDDSEDPALSDAGRRRAAGLGHLLEHAGVQTILVTSRRRTQETAAPLAARIGVDVTVVEVAGGAPAHGGAFAARVRSLPPGHTVLVVGHSNTIPAIVAALGGPDIGSIEDDDYSDLFVLQLSGDGARLIRARH